MRLTDEQIQEYRTLIDSGVEVVDDHVIRNHSGDETEIHFHAKCAIAQIGKQNGYIANCECSVPEGDIDCLLYGNPERLSYAVEIEHSPTEEIKQSKLKRYVKQTAVDELCLINANVLPMNVIEMREHIENELGL